MYSAITGEVAEQGMRFTQLVITSRFYSELDQFMLLRFRAVQVRHHWLIVPKPSWPNPGKTGLTMKFLEADEQGNQLFTFEHSKEYQAVQQQFFQAVESMQPDYIVVSC